MFAPMSVVPQLGVGIPQAHMMLPTTNLAQKASKTKGKKPTPQHSETHRAGDWVCILCSNLNYSFRKVCNRCQTQTKRDNLLQSLQLLQSPGFAGASVNVGIPNDMYRSPHYGCGGLDTRCFQSVMWGLPDGSNRSPSEEERHLPPGLEMAWSGRDLNPRNQDSKFIAVQHTPQEEFPALATTLQASAMATQIITNQTAVQTCQKDSLSTKSTAEKQGSSSRESLHSSASTEGSSASNTSQQKTKLSISSKPQLAGEQHTLYSLFCMSGSARRREGSEDGRESGVSAQKHTIGLLAHGFEEDEDEQADYVLKACFGSSECGPVSNEHTHLPQGSAEELATQELVKPVPAEMPINAADTRTGLAGWTLGSSRGSNQPLERDSSSLEVLRNLDFVLGSE